MSIRFTDFWENDGDDTDPFQKLFDSLAGGPEGTGADRAFRPLTENAAAPSNVGRLDSSPQRSVENDGLKEDDADQTSEVFAKNTDDEADDSGAPGDRGSPPQRSFQLEAPGEPNKSSSGETGGNVETAPSIIAATTATAPNAGGMVGEYRSIDGSGNNQTNVSWGSAGQDFLRVAAADYADGFSAPAGDDRPSAREISNAVFNEPEGTTDPYLVSDMFWAWGQFLDHDIDLAREGETHEAFNIQVPTGDPYFDPYGTGTQEISLNRSGYNEDTGTDSPRQQVNDITAFVDASMVYGSDASREAFLRDEGGKLKVSDGDYMPYNDGSQPNAGGPDTSLFVAGDVRANETTSLTTLHTLFVREHNRLVDELAEQHPEYTDEQLYQEAKAIVEAQIQVITYNEFLPLLLGPDALGDYSGYNASIDPGIANMFATAAYRVGHTMLSSEIQRLNSDGSESEYGNLQLRDAFFRPDLIVYEGGLDPILRGLADGQANKIDAQVIDDVRNFLFGPPGAGGFDLVSLNIQRGRDHGLASYNDAREAYGLERVDDFDDITSDVELQNILRDLYGSVDNIDPFVGGLVEDRVPGAMVGEFFLAVLTDQFMRLRDGDRFWYENRFSGDMLAALQATTLADIIERNTDIDHIQDHIFLAYNRIGGSDTNDRLYGDDGRDLVIGYDGNDMLFGREGDDQLFGDAGNDRLYGQDGNDILEGGDGRDQLFGGDGDDLLKGDAGNDTIHGNDGDDTVFGGAGDDRMYGGDGNDTLIGQSGDDQAYGGDGDDTIMGGSDDDRLYGGRGNDVVMGESGDDVVSGGSGDDLVTGGSGDDDVRGGSGDDDVQGGSGDDKVYGDGGDDIVHGGTGDDMMYGGSGADTFVFNEGDGADIIMDFSRGSSNVIKVDAALASDFSDLDTTQDNVLDENDDAISVSRGRLTIDFGEGDTLTVVGVQSLADDDITFG